MAPKAALWLLTLLFLAAAADATNTSSYEVESTHSGVAGGTGNTTSYEMTSTTAAYGGGSGNSSAYEFRGSWLNQTYTIAAPPPPPPPPPPPSGGGGGGGGPTVPSNTSTKLWTTFAAETEQVMKVFSTAVPVKQVILVSGEAGTQVELKAERLGSNPTPKEPEGTVYRFVELSLTGLDSAKLKLVKLRFQVEKNWTADQSADVSQVKMLRYTTHWAELPTEYTGSDDNYHHFNATSPGLSVFAIALGPRVAAVAEEPAVEIPSTVEIPEEPIVEETPPQDQTEPPEEPLPAPKRSALRIIISVLAFIVLLTGAGAMLYTRAARKRAK